MSNGQIRPLDTNININEITKALRIGHKIQYKFWSYRVGKF